MTVETPQQRILRLQQAGNAIIMHDPSDSFSNLIENNSELFRGFKFVYSTNNIESNFSHTSMKRIEEQCSVLKKFFYGTGLIFFSNDLYSKTRLHGRIEIPIDYSLSLDSNAAERFRVWENGGSLDKEQGRFEELIRFIKEGENKGFNFDYTFFIIENLIDSMKENNHRPFNTIRALKRFDYLEYDKKLFNVLNPVFKEDREQSGKRAIDTLHAFHSSTDIEMLINRRKGLYLILLKAVLLREKNTNSLKDNLKILIEFSLNILGAFAKTEIYFAWKLLKYGKDFKFFESISQLNEKSLHKIRGMAWDLFAIRYQETLASHSKNSDFFIPFFASFDNKFVEFAKACPIRALIVDDQDKRVMTIYLDEHEFMVDVNESLSPELNDKLRDPTEKIKRMSHRPLPQRLDEEVSQLEAEFF